jgi:hypothetical protein
MHLLKMILKATGKKGVPQGDFAILIWPTCARLIWPTFTH